MTPQDLLVSNYRMAGKMLHLQVDDLTAEEFLHQPIAGTNCVEWIVGHLTSTFHGWLKGMGVTDLPDLPEGFKEWFATTRKLAEKQVAHLEPKVLVQLFDEYLAKFSEMLRQVPTDTLDDTSKTLGVFAVNQGERLQFGALHIMFHAGQISTIRRSLGKEPRI